jgi:hypothetical protein
MITWFRFIPYSRLRPSQDRFRADCEAVGIECHVGFGLADCRRILTELGVFRPEAFT